MSQAIKTTVDTTITATRVELKRLDFLGLGLLTITMVAKIFYADDGKRRSAKFQVKCNKPSLSLLFALDAGVAGPVMWAEPSFICPWVVITLIK